jgi:hypothetical protein
MWDSVIKVLQIVHEDGRVPNQAAGLIQKKWSALNLFLLWCLC